ncbi:MAG: hypothetical protein KDA61_01200 [Planctomycetales bacterium]|nr:hypothetical protein [Planctomycetales bacterium]
MSGPAQVRSTYAIEEFRSALARFDVAALRALEGLDAQLRRADDWIQHDRPSYWKRSLADAQNAAHEAKVELERCLLFPVADERPSCREERAAYAAAQRRVEYCREKIETVRHWKQQLNHELFEYRGRLGALRQALELDLPAAKATLAKILRQLEAYRLESAPVASRGATPSESLAATSDGVRSTPKTSDAGDAPTTSQLASETNVVAEPAEQPPQTQPDVEPPAPFA